MNGGMFWPLLGSALAFGLGVCVHQVRKVIVRRRIEAAKKQAADAAALEDQVAAAAAAAAETVFRRRRAEEEERRRAAIAAAEEEERRRAAIAAAEVAAKQKPPSARVPGCDPVPGSDKLVYFCRDYTENEIELIARACANTVKTVVQEIMETANNNDVVDEAMIESYFFLKQHLNANPVKPKYEGGSKKDTPGKIGKIASNIVLAAIKSNTEKEIHNSVIKEASNLGLDSNDAKNYATMAVNDLV